jgi:phosphoesterase RecJ-like protein
VIKLHNLLFQKIEEHDVIIIHRHTNPDGDALGSQLGLKHLIKLNYPGKKVYVVGDENQFAFLGEMDNISDNQYNSALAIVVDVCVTRLVSDKRFLKASSIFVIDHHLNEPDFECDYIVEPEHIATTQIITQLFQKRKMLFNEEAATCLFTGLVTDSGRFLYPNTSALSFEIAAFLLKQGARAKDIYNRVYSEDLNIKKLKGYFIDQFKITKHGVAYMMNDKNLKDQFQVSTFTVSRGMVNQMANIKGVDIWANFTEDEDGLIYAELRSSERSIVHIARKHGGGGHALACGCTLKSFEEAYQVLEELDQFNQEGDLHE